MENVWDVVLKENLVPYESSGYMYVRSKKVIVGLNNHINDFRRIS